MKIYVDSKKHCHKTNPDNSYVEVETDFFDGKCDAFIEGFCYDTSKGYPQIYPGKPLNELEAAQAQHERDMAELQAAYQEGVNSAYD